MREKPLVLLMDDEEVFLEIASVSLAAGGMDIVTAHDFTDALLKAETLLPDLVLSDIYMPPGPNGWDLALALRRNPKTTSLKVAFFTSLRDPWMELKRNAAEMVKELGGVNFVNKMEDVPTLPERVRNIIKGEPIRL